MAGARRTRPVPERDHPFRHFATLAGESRRGGRQQESSDPNFIEQGVRSAYDVIDRYIQQGQALARTLSQTRPGEGFYPERYTEIQARALRIYLDLVSNWFELIGLGGELFIPERPREEPTHDEWEPEDQEPADSLQVNDVAYEISSRHMVRVTGEFSPGAYAGNVKSHGLRSLEGNGEPINVEFRTDQENEQLVVRIDVQPDMPPGLYTGLALDGITGEMVGNLRLELL